MGIPTKYDDEALKVYSTDNFTDTPWQPDDNNEPVFCIHCGSMEGQANLTSSEGMKGAFQVTLFVGCFCITYKLGVSGNRELLLKHRSSHIDTFVHFSGCVLCDSSFYTFSTGIFG